MAVEFSYLGSISPETPRLTIDDHPVVLSDVLDGNPAHMTVLIDGARFEVRVSLAEFNEQVWEGLYGPASDLVRTLAEATGFVRGIPYSTTIDTVVRPDGTQRPVILGDRQLAALGSFSEEDIRRIAQLTLEDFPLALALSDLLMVLAKTHYSPIACGRVADGLARLIAPDEKPKQAWSSLHATLRVDDAYVRLLSEHSKASRHGDREYVPGDITQELARRAWMLMDRYLRFRLDGALDPDVYPVLSGA